MKRAEADGARRRRWAVGVSLACTLAAACSPKVREGGGLELVIWTDGLSAPEDCDELHVEITQELEGGAYTNIEYLIPQDAMLPATFAIVAGTNADQQADIRITALLGSSPVVQREALVQVPRNRWAELPMALAKRCAGQVKTVGAEGNVESSCPTPGDSCQPDTGMCGSSVVDPSKLTTYTPGDVDAAMVASGPVEIGNDASIDRGGPASGLQDASPGSGGGGADTSGIAVGDAALDDAPLKTADSGNVDSQTTEAEAPEAGALGPSFVQVSSETPQAPAATVTATFFSPQSAGHLNVVAIGWFDTSASIRSVSDDASNVYVIAAGPQLHITQSPTAYTAITQSIYYATTVAYPPNNSVTVQFDIPASFADLRILEYAGISQSAPLDISAGASGDSSMATVGPILTSTPDLLFAAATVSTTTLGAGSSLTQRILTAPDSDIAADRILSAPGSYIGTVSIGSGSWVMQLAAFHSQ